MDGDGEVYSTTATDEGPGADPELTQPNAWPPTDLYSTEEEDVIDLYRLYVRTMPRRETLYPNMEADGVLVFFVRQPRDGDGDGGDYPRHGDADADVGTYEDAYGSSFILGAVPASGVAIACLPETTVGEARESGDGECAVCLDEYEPGEALRTMPCAHGFHERCIVAWLRASRLCPLCRFALQPEEDAETDDEEDEREASYHDDDDGAL